MQQVRKLCSGYQKRIWKLHVTSLYLVPLWIEQYGAHAVTQRIAVALQVRVRLRAVTVQDGGVATETHTQ